MEKNFVGLRFGRLLVLEKTKNYGRSYYRCRCDCGKEKEICGTSLSCKTTISCGCYRLERVKETSCTHRMTGSKELKAWYHMHERCYIPKDKKYKNYGQRDIKVCPRWHKSNPDGFLNFFKDLGRKPSLKHTLHRIDNDKDYSPENCKWADYYEQNNCRSNSVRVVVNGIEYTKKDLAVFLNVSLGAIECLQKIYELNSIVAYMQSGPRKRRNKTLLVKKSVCQN